VTSRATCSRTSGYGHFVERSLQDSKARNRSLVWLSKLGRTEKGRNHIRGWGSVMAGPVAACLQSTEDGRMNPIPRLSRIPACYPRQDLQSLLHIAQSL
jgi:hypothetical protein